MTAPPPHSPAPFQNHLYKIDSKENDEYSEIPSVTNCGTNYPNNPHLWNYFHQLMTKPMG